MNRPQPKPGILNIPAYTPGKSGVAGAARAVKLSANENALGCSPRARAAYLEAASDLSVYPDMHASALREAVAEKHGVERDRLIFGAGSDEIFALACQTFLRPGDNAVQPQFGFAAWAICVQAAGGVMRNAPERDYRADVDALLNAVDARTRIVFIANPANPTGSVIPFSEIKRLHDNLRPDILLVIDGAYSEFSEGGDYRREFALAQSAPNVLVTKTFSKIFGLAALRIGWGYGAKDVIGAVERVRPPFNTTRPGQAAALAALEDDEFLLQSVRHVVKARRDLAAFLSGCGLAPIPSAANFVTAHFGETAPISAATAESALADRGVLVRGLGSYGMSDHLRVTVGAPADMARFREAFTEIMARRRGR